MSTSNRLFQRSLLAAMIGWGVWRLGSYVRRRRREDATGQLRRVQACTGIAATPRQVWAAITEPRKAFLTSNPIARMELGSGQNAGVGTIYRWSFGLPFGGPRLAFDEIVTEWEAERRIAYRATTGWEMRTIGELHPIPSGTRDVFTIEYRLPWPWNLLVPRWLEVLGVRLALASLKRRAEAAHAVDRVQAGVPVIAFEVDIEAPPEEVFRVIGDPRSKLDWVPAIKRVELRSLGPPGPGTRYLASSAAGPVEFLFEEEITEWCPPHRLAYEGASPWGRFRSTWFVAPTSAGSLARYRMDYWFPGGRLGRLFGGLLSAAFRGAISRRTATRLQQAVGTRKGSGSLSVERETYPKPRGQLLVSGDTS
jgi:uncharacterized protein YndB with AHSA1/START domain